MTNNLLTIQKAAELLGISTRTLKRYEERGLITPQRTPGDQRRYTLEDIEILSKRTNGNIAPSSVIAPVAQSVESPHLASQTRSAKRVFWYLLILLLLIGGSYWILKTNTDALREQQAQNQLEQQALEDKVDKLRGNSYTSNLTAKDLRVAQNISTQDLLVENNLTVGGSSNLQYLNVSGGTTLANLTVTNGP